MSTQSENMELWDEKTMMLKYIKFTHGCLIIDCVENELRSLAKVSDLLSFYGLYRQVMSGDNNTTQPSYIYAEKRLKWNAWSKYKGLTKQQAMIKWEELYNKFLNQFPNIFISYNDIASLDKYHPLKPFINDEINNNNNNQDVINELELEIKGLQFQLQQQPQESTTNNNNGTKFVNLKKEQYQDMVSYVNELKHKMQKYHNEFDKNSKQIKMLKTNNDDLKSKISKIKIETQNKIDSNNNYFKRLKIYSFILCALFFMFASLKYYQKKRKK